MKSRENNLLLSEILVELRDVKELLGKVQNENELLKSQIKIQEGVIRDTIGGLKESQQSNNDNVSFIASCLKAALLVPVIGIIILILLVL